MSFYCIRQLDIYFLCKSVTNNDEICECVNHIDIFVAI